jgi:hypothetical protein
MCFINLAVFLCPCHQKTTIFRDAERMISLLRGGVPPYAALLYQGPITTAEALLLPPR